MNTLSSAAQGTRWDSRSKRHLTTHTKGKYHTVKRTSAELRFHQLLIHLSVELLFFRFDLNTVTWLLHLVKKRGELYPPFLVPGGAIAQVHQFIHLLHRFDGGHLKPQHKKCCCCVCLMTANRVLFFSTSMWHQTQKSQMCRWCCLCKQTLVSCQHTTWIEWLTEKTLSG